MNAEGEAHTDASVLNPPEVVQRHMMPNPEEELQQADILFDFFLSNIHTL